MDQVSLSSQVSPVDLFCSSISFKGKGHIRYTLTTLTTTRSLLLPLGFKLSHSVVQLSAAPVLEMGVRGEGWRAFVSLYEKYLHLCLLNYTLFCVVVGYSIVHFSFRMFSFRLACIYINSVGYLNVRKTCPCEDSFVTFFRNCVGKMNCSESDNNLDDSCERLYDLWLIVVDAC